MLASFGVLLFGVFFGDPNPAPLTGAAPSISPIARRTLAEARRDAAATAMPQPDPESAAGELREGTFQSVVLGREMSYGIYLPPGYDEGSQRYPVLYALHGVTGDWSEWLDLGIEPAANKLFGRHEIAPFIIVFPQGDQSYWFDHPGSSELWGTYLTDDVVRMIDRRYRTIPKCSARAIGGYSMGGTGALQIALRRPDLFGVVGAHSPTFREEAVDQLWFFADRAYYAGFDPFALVTSTTPPPTLKMWVDAGEDDPWLDRIEEFHQLLQARHVPHAWSIGDGGHGGPYWFGRMSEYLTFYGKALSQQ